MSPDELAWRKLSSKLLEFALRGPSATQSPEVFPKEDEKLLNLVVRDIYA